MPTKKKTLGTRLGAAKAPAGARVLIVEDNTPLRDLMADVLELEGCIVTEAFDTSSMRRCMRSGGHEEYPEQPFDLIITDIQMRGENGLVSLEKLRRSGCSTPAVVVTAFPGFATQEQAHELHATLLPKPFTLEEFRTVAAAALLPNGRALNRQ
jgi:CheY-like chemotaxis protein